MERRKVSFEELTCAFLVNNGYYVQWRLAQGDDKDMELASMAGEFQLSEKQFAMVTRYFNGQEVTAVEYEYDADPIERVCATCLPLRLYRALEGNDMAIFNQAKDELIELYYASEEQVEILRAWVKALAAEDDARLKAMLLRDGYHKKLKEVIAQTK